MDALLMQSTYLIHFLLFSSNAFIAQSQTTLSTHNRKDGKNITTSGVLPFERNETTAIKSRYIKQLNFTQKLDHFNASSNATFTQRYFQYVNCFENDTSHRDIGRMFVVVSGESEATTDLLINEHTIDAKTIMYVHTALYLACLAQFHAVVLVLEHRYYGGSKVVDVKTANASHERLRFLSVEQAVEDLAGFIRSKATDFHVPYSQVVLFGCSYAGTLVTYFRLAHPELCAGAVAFSAPLQPTFDFSAYTTTVRKKFEAKYPECYEKIDNLLKNGTIAKLAAQAKTFSNVHDVEFASLLNQSTWYKVKDNDSVRQLYAAFAGYFINMMGDMQDDDASRLIFDACEEMVKPNIASLARMLRTYYKASQNISGHTVSWSPRIFDDPDQYFWVYQTCTQFGFFQLSSSEQRDWFPRLANSEDVITPDAPHGDAMSCDHLFNMSMKDVKARVAETNRSLSKRLETNLSNYVLINGGSDPWALLSKLPPIDEKTMQKRNIKMIVVSRSYHCPFFAVWKRTIAQKRVKTFIDSVAQEIVRWSTK